MRITDDDIKMAEELILPKGERFNDERRTFIKSTESRDVLACPGSGKTTALLAKLYILAQKMPFPDGRGICVLTHTNVAIDEIQRHRHIGSQSYAGIVTTEALQKLVICQAVSYKFQSLFRGKPLEPDRHVHHGMILPEYSVPII